VALADSADATTSTYTESMSGENARDELHELVEHLPTSQLGRVLRLVRGELESTDSARPEQSPPSRRTLSFAGIVEDDPDVSRRSEELLRAEFQPRA